VEIKQKEILDRAALVIMRYGIKSVTMDDLARELSISKKTLYAHFGDKRKMIQMLVAAQVEGDKECCQIQLQESTNAIDEMFRVTSFVSERLKNVNITFFYDLRMSYPKAFQTMEDYKRGFIQETIIQNLNRGIEEGVYRQDLNPKIVAQVYLSNVEMIFGGQEFDKLNINPYELFLEIFMLHMRGIVSESGLQVLIEHLKHVTKN
jgi:TetR/AcrR family transcriptional regulator, cholesterol catabolism regulator